jgi:hypothetical protein
MISRFMTNDPAFAERIERIAYPGRTANLDVSKSLALAITLLYWRVFARAYRESPGNRPKRSRRRGRPRADHINIHDYRCYTLDAHGGALGTRHDRLVTNDSRELHDAVMYLDTDGAGDDILLPIKRGEHIVSNLHIVSHEAAPSVSIQSAAMLVAIRALVPPILVVIAMVAAIVVAFAWPHQAACRKADQSQQESAVRNALRICHGRSYEVDPTIAHGHHAASVPRLSVRCTA